MSLGFHLVLNGRFRAKLRLVFRGRLAALVLHAITSGLLGPTVTKSGNAPVRAVEGA
jgi:hypothetical protein